jgi:flagellar hook protein FlgE
MIDSIFVAMSGMLGHERGLNVISNNVTNMNTTAFRGSSVSFADVFIGTMPNGTRGGLQARAGGLDASRTTMDFRAGDRAPTGQELDLFLNGDGFFVVQEEDGGIRYTRDGHFDINDDNELVLAGQKVKVMTRNAGGQLVPITLGDLRVSAGRATTQIEFTGNLDPTDPEHVIESLAIFDSAGRKHTLRVEFDRDTTSGGGLVSWNVRVFQADQEIGADILRFSSIAAVPETLRINLNLAGAEPTELEFEFEFPDVTGSPGTSSGSQSNLSVKEQDGFDVGTIATRTFDDKGVLKLTYSNGQKADGPRLVLAQIDDRAGLVPVGNSRFEYRGTRSVALREGGDDLTVVSGALERANVSLTQQFSELVLMQRGYQASSQVLSTANDMIQELLDLRGGR